MDLDAGKLADLHLDLLYERDEAGLMLGSRDPDIAAPLVHMVRTPSGNRWYLSAALTSEQREAFEQALAAEAPLANLAEEPAVPDGLLRLAASILGREAVVWRGPVFSFPELLPAPGAAELLTRLAGESTAAGLEWVTTTQVGAQPIAVVRNTQGQVVSVCHSARSIDTAAEAGLETAPDYRGLGHAALVVSAWAAAVRQGGRVPVYSTAWSNVASRSVARKLGLVIFGEDFSVS